MQDQEPNFYVHIPYQTIIVVLVTLIFAHLAVLIAPLILPILIAVLMAVALTPVVDWFVGKGFRRGTAVSLVTLLMALVIGLTCYLIVPTIYQQVSTFVENFPQEKAKLLESFDKGNPIRGLIEKGVNSNSIQLNEKNIGQLMGFGNIILGGLTETILIFVFAIYLLADGPRMVEWLSAFFSSKVRNKVDQTCFEGSKIISAYVLGQVITSVLSFVFVFIVLSVLKVPNVTLLAAMAGLFDVLPVLGFILAVVPAMVFALSVSGTTSLIVLGAYIFYHTIENYVIVPMVYGNRLRVSSFVVFSSLIAAGLVAGVEGAIAVLPIVASYPVMEKIWLTGVVRKEAIQVHAAERAEDAAEAARV